MQVDEAEVKLIMRQVEGISWEAAVEEATRRQLLNPDYLTDIQVESILAWSDRGIGWGKVPRARRGPYAGYTYRIDRDDDDRARRIITVFGEEALSGRVLRVSIHPDESIPQRTIERSGLVEHHDELRRLAGWGSP